MSEHENMEQEVTEIETVKKPAKADASKTDLKKAKPAEKKKQGNRVARYFREMKSELKKVVWPTRKQTFNNTGIVIVCVIIVGVFVWIFDGVAGQLIRALLSLFGS